MTEKVDPVPATNPWRVWGLLAILGILIAIALGWGVQYYFVSNATIAIRDRRLLEAHDHLNRAKWWGGETSLLQARTARLEGDLTSAGRYLQAAHRTGGDPTEVHLEQLMLSAQSGHLQPLLSELSFLIGDGSHDSGELFFALCRGQLLIGDLQEAKSTIDRWISADSSDPRGYFELGRYNEMIDNLPDARSAFQRTVELSPYWSDARLRLAQATLSSAEPELATALFEQVLVSDPNNSSAILGCGLAMLRANRLEDAARVLAPITARQLTSDAEKLAIAELEVAEEKYRQAQETLAPCLERWPKLLQLNELLLRIHLGLNDPESAAQCEKVIEEAKAAMETFHETKQINLESKTEHFAIWLRMAKDIYPYAPGLAIHPLLLALHFNPNEIEPFEMLSQCFKLRERDRLASTYGDIARGLQAQKEQERESQSLQAKPPAVTN